MAGGCVVLVEAGKESKKCAGLQLLQAGDVPGLSKTVGPGVKSQSGGSIAPLRSCPACSAGNDGLSVGHGPHGLAPGVLVTTTTSTSMHHTAQYTSLRVQDGGWSQITLVHKNVQLLSMKRVCMLSTWLTARVASQLSHNSTFLEQLHRFLCHCQL